MLRWLGMTNNKQNENKSEFNVFMQSQHDRYTQDVLSEFGDADGFKENHMPYEEWLDAFSWEELCDYADLFKSIKA